MEWLVSLAGDVDTLQELSKSCISPELFIGKERDIFVLRMKEFETMENADSVLDEALKAISIINGVLKSLGFQNSLVVEEVIREDYEGKWHYHVTAAGGSKSSCRVKVTVKSADGTVKEVSETEPVLRWFLLAKGSEEVAKVFRLLGKANPEWTSNFYRIYEIIRDDVRNISQKGWVPSKDVKRFTGTVNNPDLIGDIARHGVPQTGKKHLMKNQPMTFHEARGFINNIVSKWLCEKS